MRTGIRRIPPCGRYPTTAPRGALSEARQGRHGEFEGAKPLHQAPSGAARSAGGKHRYLHENSHRRSVDGYFRGDSRIRTGDPMLAKHVLYQLSYTPGGIVP